VSNRGLLIASGFVAGEALMGICLAILVALKVKLFAAADAVAGLEEQGYSVLATTPDWFGWKWLGAMVIVGLAAYLIMGSLKALRDRGEQEASPPSDETS